MKAKLVEDFKYLKPKSEEEITTQVQQYRNLIDLAHEYIKTLNTYVLSYPDETPRESGINFINSNYGFKFNSVSYDINNENKYALEYDPLARKIYLFFKQRLSYKYREFFGITSYYNDSVKLMKIESLEQFKKIINDEHRVDESFKYLKPKSEEEIQDAWSQLSNAEIFKMWLRANTTSEQERRCVKELEKRKATFELDRIFFYKNSFGTHKI